MEYYNTKKRFCPHLIETKVKAVKMFRQTKNVNYATRRYHVGRASVYRRNDQYDGTRESLENKSHKPKTPHPNFHTEQEIKSRVCPLGVQKEAGIREKEKSSPR